MVGASDGGGGGGLIISVTRSVLSNGRPAVVPRSRNQPDPSHRPNCPRATRPHPGRRFPQAKSCRNARFRAPESRVRLPAGARRGAGDRRGDGAGVPRRVRLDVGRLRRRVGVLHAVGLPDHVAGPGRARSHRTPRRRVRSTPAGSAGCCRPAWSASLGVDRARPRPGMFARRRPPAARPLGRAGSRSTTGSPSPAGRATPSSSPRAAGQRSPLDHYWSLAIEEQFYWVWPLVLIVVLRWPAPRRVAAPSAAADRRLRRRRAGDRGGWGPDAAY